MAASQKFRSALNGFNREDVVHYIEFTNARHEAEVSRLKEELDSLRKELAARTVWQPEEDPRLDELEQKCAALEQENAALREQAAAPVPSQTPAEEELAAYRRAERVERLAQNRVSQMYNRANAALADTAANLDAVAADLSRVAENAMEQIHALQNAVAGSKQVISDAAVVLGSIRPESDEE